MIEVKCKTTTLGVMQPYFFPYAGYFSLIKATDKWIVFDTPQYTYRSWINRNRIIDPNHNGWMFITVPLKQHPLNTAINRIKIQNDEHWKKKIQAQMLYYKIRAPYYNQVMDFLKEVLEPMFDNLCDLNIYTLRKTCDYLGLEFNYEVFSQMDIAIEPVSMPDEWGLNICKSLNIKEFINPERGQTFVNRMKYSSSNVHLQFLEYGYPVYNQGRDHFTCGLSILDAMMFNTPDEIAEMLNDYKLI